MTDTKWPSLEPYCVSSTPASMFYIPNFITKDEEEYILNKASIKSHIDSDLY